MGTGLLALVGTAWGQASEAEMRAFPMPPAQGYAAEKVFAYTGDYGYYLFPSSSFPGGGVSPSDYDYVRYTGLSGKRVYVYGAWGNTPIPPPSRDTQGRLVDACGHAHSSYGVWGKYEFYIPFVGRLTGWAFLGGGGKSGKRNASGQCIVSTDNDLKSIDARYGWGQDVLSFDFTGGTFFTELVVAAQSNTHGWGSCAVASGTFKACREPSYIIGYTLW